VLISPSTRLPSPDSLSRHFAPGRSLFVISISQIVHLFNDGHPRKNLPAVVPSTHRTMSHAEELPELMTQLEIGDDSNPRQTATSSSVPWPWSNIPLKTWNDVAEDGDAGQNSTFTISFEAPTFPLTEFTCFPKFPKEWRLKTWKHAATIPRNIDL
jgi:hypothetical protein